MNKHKILLTAALSACIALTGCDNIEEDNRYIESGLAESEKVVLIQEFSGQMCSNCPDGAAAVHNMLAAYPKNVVAVGMMPIGTNYTNVTGPLDAGLNSETATEYYQAYGPDSFPAVIVDGQLKVGLPSIWGSFLKDALEVTPPADIELVSEYNAETREIQLSYAVKFTAVQKGQINMVLWLVENNIVGFQLNGSKYDMEYTHNHVLRTSLNGTWGQSIGDNFVPGDVYQGVATLKLKDEWKAENCQVVGFLQLPTRDVVQACITDVM